jgi:hypothetical protein
MAHLQIDSIGELPVDDDGNKHIIVIIDRCTRYCDLFPAKSTEAVEAAKALIQWMGIFNSPVTLTSDNGTQYVNNTISELCRLTGVDHKKTIAYSKQENAIVERSNLEVMRHLKAYRFDLKTISTWGLLLPLVKRIINRTHHENIGCSPNELVFGSLRHIDETVFAQTDNVNMGTWSTQLLNMQEKFLQRARLIQYGVDTKHLEERAPEQPLTEFPINSLVLLSYPETRMGALPPTKFHPPLKGPFKVHSRSGDMYVLKNLVINKLEPGVHVSRLKPFRYDPLRIDPAKIAQTDTLDSEVAEILAHTGNVNKVSTLDFKVRWTGESSDNDLWLPWKELKNNTLLHQYLIENGLHKLVPKQYVSLEQLRMRRLRQHNQTSVENSRASNLPIEPKRRGRPRKIY